LNKVVKKKYNAIEPLLKIVDHLNFFQKNSLTACLIFLKLFAVSEYRIFARRGKSQNLIIHFSGGGAYASAFWVPSVATIYTNQTIYQLSDGSLFVSKRWPDIIDTVWKAESQSFLKFTIGDDPFENALLNQSNSLNARIKNLHCNTLYGLVLPKFIDALK
jgi:hypothetical protein